MSMDWFDDGFDGDVKGGRSSSSKNAFRFFIKRGEEDKKVNLMFLDDVVNGHDFEVEGKDDPVTVCPPFKVKEHRYKANGHYNNWATCLATKGEPCPMCQAGDTPALTGFMTVIDYSRYTDRSGSEKRYSKKLYPVKTSHAMWKRLKHLREEAENMRGMRVKVCRLGQMSCPAGTDILKSKLCDIDDELDKIKQTGGFDEETMEYFSQPFNYLQELAPGSVEEYKHIVATSPTFASKGDQYNKGEFDDDGFDDFGDKGEIEF